MNMQVVRNGKGSMFSVPGQNLLQVKNLSVELPIAGSPVRIVDDVSFDIAVGEHVALVGESGSGKSMTAQALMRLNRKVRLSGAVNLNGVDLLSLPERAMSAQRGSSISMVFQDPMMSLDPLMTIGDQVAETLRIRGVGKAEARKRALSVLDELGVDRAAERLDSYPHEFSGGMRQRVVLAMALVGEPELLIADEPTTALDVRVQEQVLRVLDEASQRRNLAVLLITHDLGIVAGFANRVIVMYAGRLVEEASVERIFDEPAHPYTSGLLASVPRIDQKVERLASVPGAAPPAMARPSGCAFHPRCGLRIEDVCSRTLPVLRQFDGRQVACHLFDAEREG